MSHSNFDAQLKDLSGRLASFPVSPAKIMVIIGLLSGAFDVDSVLVGRNQEVEIILSGTFKQKTQLEQMMDQMGKQPFDEVMQAIIGRLV